MSKTFSWAQSYDFLEEKQTAKSKKNKKEHNIVTFRFYFSVFGDSTAGEKPLRKRGGFTLQQAKAYAPASAGTLFSVPTQ